MLKAIKVRLYPNKEQEEQLNKLLGCYRVVYNQCLERKITSYQTNKTNENLATLGKYFHGTLLKDKNFEWLNEHNTKVLKQAIINMLDAYKRFFTVQGTGFPKFKKKGNEQSCRFPKDCISTKNVYSDNKITLTGMTFKFRCSEEYTKTLTKHKDRVKSCTLRRMSSGKYFLSILIETNEPTILVKNEKSVGIDVGIKTFATCSDNQVFENLNTMKKLSKQLKKLHKQLSKKKLGSNNRYKAKIRLARLYEKIANIQNNYLHNISRQLVNENQIITIEDLNLKGMMKNHKLAGAIQSLSIGEFFRMLDYKADWGGRTLIQVGRFYPSSKTCFECKHINKELKLSDRIWTCPCCKTTLDRDLNAAKNIEYEGLRLLLLQKQEIDELLNSLKV